MFHKTLCFIRSHAAQQCSGLGVIVGGRSIKQYLFANVGFAQKLSLCLYAQEHKTDIKMIKMELSRSIYIFINEFEELCLLLLLLLSYLCDKIRQQ